MPRKFIKKLLPEHRTVVENRWLSPFRALLHDPALIVPHRRAVARGFAVGLFWAFMPVPLQSFFATATCIWLRVNVLIAIAACWISNPFTAVPILYTAGWIGTLILGPAHPLPPPHAAGAIDGSVAVATPLDLWDQMMSLGQAVILGMFVISTVAAVLGYVVVNTLWLWSVRRDFARRRRGRPGVSAAPRP